MTNSERFPEAWKIYIDCVRKWEETDLLEYPPRRMEIWYS